MDFLRCAGLAVLEVSLFKKFQLIGVHGSSLNLFAGLCIGQYLLLKFYRIWLYPKHLSPLRHVPGPEDGHFLFGQAIKKMQAPTPTSLYLSWMKQFPEAPFIRHLSFFNTEVLVCNSPDACRDVLQTHFDSVPHSTWFKHSTKNVVGQSLLAQVGPTHKAHRKMFAAPFSYGNIIRMHDLFRTKARELGTAIEQVIDHGSEDGKSGVLDCTDLFTRAFLDIIGVAVLGEELQNLSTVSLETRRFEDHPYHRAFAEFFAPPTKLKQLLSLASGYVPVRWMPLQSNRDFNSAMESLHTVVERLIEKRVAEIGSGSPDGKQDKSQAADLLTFILEESLPGGSAEGTPTNILKDNLLVFIGAGFETSANTLSFCAMVLAQNHAIQDKLRADIQGLLSKKPDPSYAEIDKLPYLENFLKEVLRVYPPASTLFLQSKEDLVIEGIEIPSGTLVEMCCATINRNPLIWGDDADVVDPDRWNAVGLSPGDKRLNTFAYEAFSNGPRICLGKNFANLELKTILIELVQNFRFVSVVQEPYYPNPAMVLAPRDLKVKLQRI